MSEAAHQDRASPSSDTLLIWAHWTMLLLSDSVVRFCEERGSQSPGWPADAANALLEAAQRKAVGGGTVPGSVQDHRHGGPVRDFRDPLTSLYLLSYCPERVGLSIGQTGSVPRIIGIRNDLQHRPGDLSLKAVLRLTRDAGALLGALGDEERRDRVDALARLVGSQREFPYRPRAPAKATLFVIPCSSKKATTGGPRHPTEGGVVDHIGSEVAARLSQARDQCRDRARVDEESGWLPAFERYAEGSLWKGGGSALPEAIRDRQAHVLILSGAYGVVRWDEDLGHYDRDLRLADWPENVLGEVLADYARANRIRSVVGLFNARFPEYREAFAGAPWSDADVEEVVLLEPRSLGGAPAESDQALGECLRDVLVTGKIRSWWLGSSETVLTREVLHTAAHVTA